MKWTNEHDLPKPLYRAIVNDKYISRGYISVTALIGSPRIRVLKQRHYQELTQDVVENFWALFGTACHHIIELAAEGCDDYLSEVKLSITILGKELTGTVDLYDKIKKSVDDFKVTSVWSATKKEDYGDWEAQLNIYAVMLRAMGYEVNQLNILAILKDWHRAEVARNFGDAGMYPEIPFKEIPMKMYSNENMIKFMENRMQMHIDAEQIGAVLPECTERERWTKKTTYALKSPLLKRAIRVFDNIDDALLELPLEAQRKNAKKARSGDKLFIETRHGKDVRCEGFCPVAQFCDQYQNSLQSKS